MARLWALLLLCLPAAAHGGEAPPAPEEPVIVVRVADRELKTRTLGFGRGEEDVKDLESFLLVNMARRGVCLSKLGPVFYERLRAVLSKAAQELPVRFHYFALLAPQFDERRVTDIFVVLRDAPEGFSRFVEAQVRFYQESGPGAEGPRGGRRGESDGPGGLREAAVSEAAMREYQRYQNHCPVVWVRDAETGEPPAICGYETWDLKGAMDRVMGDNFAGSSASPDGGLGGESRTSPVSGAGPLKALGPAEPSAR